MSGERRAQRRGLPIGLRHRRGFTLIELSVVIVVIAVFATLAAPSVVQQMRDRRVQEAARQIATVYRQARLRALGRGAAVLVRYNGTSFSVFEARMGAAAPSAACADLPSSSCLTTPWDTAANVRLVDAAEGTRAGDPSITLTLSDNAGSTLTALDICFTPSGRTFSRPVANSSQPLTPFSTTVLATLDPTGRARTRSVVLMPNGTARMSQ